MNDLSSRDAHRIYPLCISVSVQEIKHQMLQRLQSVPEDETTSNTTTTAATATTTSVSHSPQHTSSESNVYNANGSVTPPVPALSPRLRMLSSDSDGGSTGKKRSKEDRKEGDWSQKRKKEVEKNIAENKHVLVEEEAVQSKEVRPCRISPPPPPPPGEPVVSTEAEHDLGFLSSLK